MFGAINKAYRARKKADADNRLILESVLDVEETIPGSDEEMEDLVDTDSVPEDVYKALDRELDRIVSDPKYDDTEAEELVDDEYNEDEISDDELDAVIDEAVNLMDLAEASKTKTYAAVGAIGGAITGARAAANHAAKNDEGYQKAVQRVKDAGQRVKDSESYAEIPYTDDEGHTTTQRVTVSTPESRKAAQELRDANAGQSKAYRAALRGNGGRIIKGALKGAVAGGVGGAAIGYARSKNEDANPYAAIAESVRLGLHEEDESQMRNEHVTDFGGLDQLMEENYSQFVNGKYHMQGGKAYQPITKNSYVTDEAKIEEEALRESSGLSGLNEWAAENGYGAVARTALLREGTESDVEDFPSQTGAGNDHGAKMDDFEAHEAPEDFPNSTGSKKMGSGDDPTDRYKAVAEAATRDHAAIGAVSGAVGGAAMGALSHSVDGAVIGAIGGRVLNKEARAARKHARDLAKDPNASLEDISKAKARAKAISHEAMMRGMKKGAKIGAGVGAVRGGAVGARAGYAAGKLDQSVDESSDSIYHQIAEAVSNPDVDDFPGSEGTKTADGTHVGIPAERYGGVAGYGDESDFEQDEVDVEDGDDDAIGIIKANEAVSQFIGMISETESSASTAGGTRICEPGTECPADFPKALPRETKGEPAGYGDESDFERREVGVEDGGEDVIDVIKANESVGSIAYLRSLLQG